MWPSVAYIVEPSKLGTAYGVMTMVQNIGLFGFNLLIGWANDWGHAGRVELQEGLPVWECGSFPRFWVSWGVFFAFLLRRRESWDLARHGLETITAGSQAIQPGKFASVSGRMVEIAGAIAELYNILGCKICRLARMRGFRGGRNGLAMGGDRISLANLPQTAGLDNLGPRLPAVIPRDTLKQYNVGDLCRI